MTKPEKAPPARVLDAICTQQWAILPEALHTIIEIAHRRQSDLESVRMVLAERGQDLRDTARVIVRDGVAIVPVRGPIFRYANLFTAMSGASSIEVLATDFGAAVRNSAVRAIVLDIDSPGGQVAGVSEFAEQVRAATEIKPVVAYASDTAASAAYWIAVAADELVIRDTARVGSIGVVTQVYRDRDDEDAMKFVSAQSPRKHADPASDVGRNEYQAMVDALADVFIANVASYRGVAVDTVLNDFGQGAVLVGHAAVVAGMADRLGSLESIIAGLAGATSQPTPRRTRMDDKTPKPLTAASIAADHPAVADALRKEGADAVPTTTLELVCELHPDIAAALRAEGATTERARIQAVQAQAHDLPGHEQLVAELMFDGTTTSEQAAVRILAAERSTRAQLAQDIKADARLLDGKAPGAPTPAGPTDRAHLPLEERCKAEWDESPKLRAEYGERFERYVAFERAQAAGRVRFSSAKS